MSSNCTTPSDVVTDPGLIDVLCVLGLPAGSWVQLGGPLEKIDIPSYWKGDWVEVINRGNRDGEEELYNARYPHPIVATTRRHDRESVGDDPWPLELDEEDTWVVCRAHIKAWKPKTTG